MAENFADYLVKLSVEHKDFLGQIRHWDNLKLAVELTDIWIKNFTETQLNSAELLSIPFISIYVCKDNLIFPKGSLLPLKKMPNLLWSPIERALTVEIGDYNHNFFGIHQTLLINLVPTQNEKVATILFVKCKEVDSFFQTAPKIRLDALKWCVVEENNALIFGEPMLPIKGKAFWQHGDFILPVGWELAYPILAETIEKKINPLGKYFIWWTSNEHYNLVEKTLLRSLSIASWRQTVKI